MLTEVTGGPLMEESRAQANRACMLGPIDYGVPGFTCYIGAGIPTAFLLSESVPTGMSCSIKGNFNTLPKSEPYVAR